MVGCFARAIYFLRLLRCCRVHGSGYFVKATSQVYMRDRDFIIAEEQKRLDEYAKDIKDFFIEADKDSRSTHHTTEKTLHALETPNLIEQLLYVDAPRLHFEHVCTELRMTP